MRWPTPLVPGRLVRRYKRFLADVVLDGDSGAVTVHCPNPGRMLGLDAPGARVWVSRASNPARALPLTLELVEANGGLVGINTMHPNRLVEEAIGAGRIPELRDYRVIRREVRYDQRCRIDLLLHRDGRPDCFVEVKNVHLKRTAGAEFPDAVTVRGAKHLGALARQVTAGARAVVVYVVQRTDCADFRIAEDIDPVYGASFRAALAAGVEAVCYACELSLDGVRLARSLPILPD
ncbi:MAG TPA: DNA/RNA nuclease SfsA [Geminicoccaceae bacterium]